MADLCWFAACLVPFRGLSDIDLKPWETVIVVPATGRFGGAAVTIALAMGAKLVAAGRNTKVLGTLEQNFGETGRLHTVVLTGDVKVDSQALRKASGPKGTVAYIDFSPTGCCQKYSHYSSSSILEVWR